MAETLTGDDENAHFQQGGGAVAMGKLCLRVSTSKWLILSTRNLPEIIVELTKLTP